MKTELIHIRIHSDTKAELQRVAKKKNRTVTELLTKFIESLIAKK